MKRSLLLTLLFASFFYLNVQNVCAQSWSTQSLSSSYYLNGISSGAANQACAVGLFGAIITTNDGGTTWTTQTSGTTNNLWSTSFVSATQGWATGNGGMILTTTDGGASWSTQTSAVTSQLYGVYFFNANYGWAVGNQGKVEATTNGGVTWTAQNSNLPTTGRPPHTTIAALQAVYFASSTQGWAVGGSGSIIATSDGGTTWATQTSGTTQTLTGVYFISATTGWAVGGSGTILFTSNGGSTWTSQTSGTTNSLTSVYFKNATQGWAVGGSGTILTTSDAGATWTSQTSGTTTSIQGVRFTSNGRGFGVLYGSSTILTLAPPAATTITSITGSSAYSSAAAVNYNVTFGGAVTGVTASNFSLTTTGVTDASVGTPTTADNLTWTVPVNTGTGDGTIGLNLSNATGLSLAISDALPFNGGSVVIDKTAPVVTIGSPSVASLAAGTADVTYNVAYNDANFNASTLSTGDITLNTTGTATGTAAVTGTGAAQTVTITGITGQGTIGISIAAGTASDKAGNTAAATGPSTTFSVMLAEQITFSALSAKNYGDIDFSPGATSNNNSIPITYSSDNLSVASIVNGSIHIKGAGTANITASQAGDDSNIAAPDVVQQLTVGKAALTITADDQVKAYGAAVPALTASYNGFVNGDTPDSLSTQPTLGTTATAASHVLGSPYAITADGAASLNYTISYLAGALTVNAAPLTITAADQTKQYGAELPVLTASYTGFVNGDTADNLTTAPTLSTTATASSPLAGNPYAITASGAVDADYSISYVSGVLTIIAGSDATLSALGTPGNNLTPVFNSGTLSYTATVTNGTTTTTVTPTATDANAAIAVQVNNGGYTAVSSGSASTPLALNLGENAIDVNVTAQDGVTTKTYTITVTRTPLTNALLSGLAFDPYFKATTVPGPDYKNYSGMVANSVSSITLKPVTQDPTATVTVNGTVVSSGLSSAPIALNIGANVITTVVKAQDGITTKTYSTTVMRQGNALLSTLKFSTPFTINTVTGPGYKNYTASVNSSISSVQVIPSTEDPTSTIKVNGVTVVSGTASDPIALTIGANTINTVVTATDGTTTKTYTIVITRTYSTLLTSLKFSPTIPVTTVSGPNYKDYAATVKNTVSSVTIIPLAQDPSATITVNGITVASGTASMPIPLNVGDNAITTVVTAGDGIATRTYSVTINRGVNALLSSLTFSPRITLATVAGVNYKDYTATVNSTVSSVTLKPVTQDATSTITVNGTPVISGTASAAIPLNVGDNTIAAIVTAKDGTTTNTYSSVITRLAPAVVASNYNATLVAMAPVSTPEILVHQNVSPNGDGNGDVLKIDGIAAYPENTLQIMSRNGALVYEAKGYDNATKAFDGHASTNGKLQEPGTYFYALTYKAGTETIYKTGYFVIKY
ncbi:cadherin-like beta sandwich domain-containing protein [Mucilaginibacter xinganensis]|uniref:Cadherin-like beta sandwich domain-containing protein n=1 Tax=Mucilaginibacter xinganensis TaxID=1234841 RepID=A0A223P3E6_9SPHI|nr:cadherin-like beta sandwich domain-containing protein [Mucilaginibacter xinganensis]ASU36570.1 Cadherin-like beta sandwich domain-containing protein [Mucilaginibacter xinganensis]